MEQNHEASCGPAEPVAVQDDVSCSCDTGSGLLYTWRRQMLEGEGFWGDEVTQHQPIVAVPTEGRHVNGKNSPTPLGQGLIEITLAGGVCVRVDNNVDATALRRVLDALQGR